MSSLRQRLHRVRRGLRRTVLARRRLLAALFAGVAVLAGVRAATAPPPPTVTVLSAARDLPSGTVLATDDVRPLELPADAVPSGTAERAVGRALAAPVREGEPLTDVRLVGAELAAAHRELTTMPVRLPDGGVADLLSVGDRIDLIATDPQAGDSTVVAGGALVLATPAPGDQQAAAETGRVVVLGVPPGAETAVADAAARFFLSYAYAH